MSCLQTAVPDVRQHQVEQHQVGPLLACEAQALVTELGHDRVVAGLLQVVFKDLLEVRLVFDDRILAIWPSVPVV